MTQRPQFQDRFLTQALRTPFPFPNPVQLVTSFPASELVDAQLFGQLHQLTILGLFAFHGQHQHCAEHVQMAILQGFPGSMAQLSISKILPFEQLCKKSLIELHNNTSHFTHLSVQFLPWKRAKIADRIHCRAGQTGHLPLLPHPHQTSFSSQNSPQPPTPVMK